ncbi:glycosyl hydrolase family 81-domain-containing protein [Auriculariales sp. MPI-PUGE-AT-0066]|nr:glycosyl hydrolase family 81-domain-containing protein [Auriculariales sp. MPI-PUGE-AT-0066]
MPLRPISKSRPRLPGGDVANTAPPGPFFQGHSPPFPTCTWWVGFAAPPNQDAIAAGPFPYMSSCGDDGLAFGLPRKRDCDGVSVHQPAQLDWVASFREHRAGRTDRRAVVWDEQSVTVEYFSPPRTSLMTSFLVPGAPYMTFRYTNATPIFRCLESRIVSINGTAMCEGQTVHVSEPKITVVTENGVYLLYSLGMRLGVVASTFEIVATGPITGVLRIAFLAQPTHERALDASARSYPTGVCTEYEFQGDIGSMLFKWDVVGPTNTFIHLSWPHHRKALVSPQYLGADALSYLTIKGWMIPVRGTTWRLAYDLPLMDFHPPRRADGSCLPAIIRGLEYEVAALEDPPEPGDFYFWGGALAAKARLALIAEHVGRLDLVSRVVDYLAQSINHWMDTSYTRVQVAYETNWGAIINREGASNVHVDFGNGFMNDHLFHYGYILAAASTVARFRSDWLDETNGLASNREFLEWFVRDIANPSKEDPYFPIARHRDFFAGHSWASGIANGAGDRDQESLSEAINGAYGVLLYATVTRNSELRDFARLLIATEQAAGIYWHLNPHASPSDLDEPYPEPELRSLVTIGNVMQWQAGAWLFWGSQKAQIAAIQVLPVIPVNELYYRSPWVADMLRYVQSELDDPSVGDEWKSVIYLALSNVDPHRAMQLSLQLTSWGSGNTYTNQLHFIATRHNPSGRPIMPMERVLDLNGTFSLQASDGRWISSRSNRPELVADARSSSQAAGFSIGFAPGGVTIRHATTGQYVTADISGEHALSAARERVAAWEVFKLVPHPNHQPTSYAIVAGSNKQHVRICEDGRLLPNAPPAEAAIFTLGSAPAHKNPIGRFYMQHSGDATFLRVDDAGGKLLAAARTLGEADVFVWHGDAMSFQCERTRQFVTASPDGNWPLCAARDVAFAWEHVWVDQAEECAMEMTIRTLVNERFVVVDQDGTLVNSQEAPKLASRFAFVLA